MLKKGSEEYDIYVFDLDEAITALLDHIQVTARIHVPKVNGINISINPAQKELRVVIPRVQDAPYDISGPPAGRLNS